jgi:hypothetical protein
MRNEKTYVYFSKPSSKSTRHAHMVEELFISPLGVHMRYIIRLHFLASNNVTEYEALITGLRIAVELGVRHLDVLGDS